MKLSIQSVHKTYPNGVEAVKGLSLEIAAGEVFGLVGPNGAGKSTLLKTICGLLRPESGSVLYGDEHITGMPQKAAKHIGLMPDPLGVYTDITAHDYLEFFARVLNIPESERAARISEVVEELELQPWLNEEVETLSAGWQRRLALGRILLANTPVLLLDEPAAGLDVSARKELLEIVRRLAAKNRAVIISSHILPELEDLADRFGIIDRGEWKPVAEGKTFFTRHDLATGLGKPMARIRCSKPDDACRLLCQNGIEAATENGEIAFPVADGDEQIAAAISVLCRNGHSVYSANRQNACLSDVALSVLGKNKGEQP
ncbi:MAG: ABC transporter ATP-binding protein [Kiritimatiellia bacterium]